MLFINPMFGGGSALVRGHMFVFSYKELIACWVSKEKYEQALKIPGAERVEIREGIPMGTWVFFPAHLYEKLLPWIRASYKHYLSAPSKKRRPKNK